MYSVCQATTGPSGEVHSNILSTKFSRHTPAAELNNRVSPIMTKLIYLYSLVDWSPPTKLWDDMHLELLFYTWHRSKNSLPNVWIEFTKDE